VAIAIKPLAVSRALNRGGILRPDSRDYVPLGAIRHRPPSPIPSGAKRIAVEEVPMVDDRLIRVGCERDRDRWRCEVRIGDGPGATRHQVTVRDKDLLRLAPAGTSVERLAEASFAFLLEREPRKSILRQFDLPVIARTAELRRMRVNAR
jgi:hypothetical protein